MELGRERPVDLGRAVQGRDPDGELDHVHQPLLHLKLRGPIIPPPPRPNEILAALSSVPVETFGVRPQPWTLGALAVSELIRGPELVRTFGSNELQEHLLPALRGAAELVTELEVEARHPDYPWWQLGGFVTTGEAVQRDRLWSRTRWAAFGAVLLRTTIDMVGAGVATVDGLVAFAIWPVGLALIGVIARE